jgi:putative ABC transport system permease protein
VETTADYLRFALMGQRIGGSVLGFLAAIALALAALGLYGVLSYNVSRRTRELGVRMAFGATPPEVRRLIFAQGFRLFVVGLPLGAAGAVALGLALRSQLYGVSPADPVTLVAAALVLAAVLVAATAIPAWRASRLDPLAALTHLS